MNDSIQCKKFARELSVTHRSTGGGRGDEPDLGAGGRLLNPPDVVGAGGVAEAGGVSG
jgi:hypothetical protein